jgi:hypothetical protein
MSELPPRQTRAFRKVVGATELLRPSASSSSPSGIVYVYMVPVESVFGIAGQL